MRGRPHDYEIFFAAQLPSAVGARTARFTENLKGQLALKGVPRRPDLLHVSLVDLFTSRQPIAPAMVEDFEGLASQVSVSPFLVELDRLQGWNAKQAARGEPGPIVLCGGEGVIGFDLLRANLLHALNREDKSAFTPHATLIWSRTLIEPQDCEPFRWTVSEFVLIQSHRGRGRHEVLARFPFIATGLSASWG
jgi:2'-5' RNA ligase